MNKEIKSEVIGKLTQDYDIPEWWTSTLIEIPYFDYFKLPITYWGIEPEKDKTFLKDADEALISFLKLTMVERKAISELVYNNYLRYLNTIEFDDNEQLIIINELNEIWNYIHPTEIYIRRRHRRDKDIYLQVCCECDWEKEHGLQFVFKQGKKLTRISDQDDHLTDADAYDITDEDDELLKLF